MSSIRAAGGVVVNEHGEIAVVHRPHHEDWSLPKGKLDPGEDWAAAALREVWEECGLRCDLGEPLPPTRYEVGGVPKEVRWWRMTVVRDTGFEPSEEVDERRWVAPAEALELLSHADDRALVRALSCPG